MTDKPPDSAPATREAILECLAWMRQRCKKIPRYYGMEEHWVTSLQTLTMGELRQGARFFQGLSAPNYMPPHLFWLVCKGQQPKEIAAHIKRLRRAAARKPEDTP